MHRTRVLAAILAGALATLAAAAPAWADGDAAKGEKVFAPCKICHSLESGTNKIGPSLHGIVGRKSGTAPGFTYSDAMAKAGLTWDEATLKKYIANPKAVVPGNKMMFAGVKKGEDIENLITFLKEKGK